MQKTEYFFGELVSYSCISVVGLGYIGLPTAAVLASQKNKVVGIDINQDTVDVINSGKVHIVEPGLDAIVNGVVKAGFLKATTLPVPSDVFLIAVPTPFKKNAPTDKVPQPDISYIEAAIRASVQMQGW